MAARSRTLRGGRSPIRAAALAAPVVALAHPALAESAPTMVDHLGRSGALGLALTLGLFIFAVVTGWIHLRARSRWERREAGLSAELGEVAAFAERARVALGAERQVFVVWGGAGDAPLVEGDPSLVTGAAPGVRLLAFGQWLPPEQAQALEGEVAALRASGQPLRRSLRTRDGRYLEAEGRPVAGRAVLRLRDAGGEREALHCAQAERETASAEAATLRALLDALPQPAWVRDGLGKLSFVNQAYARAVEAGDPAEVLARGIDILDRTERETLGAALAARPAAQARLTALAYGERRPFEVTAVDGPGGRAALALDRSEAEAVRADLERQMEAHAGVLDQLATAVAIFDRGGRLVYQNAAYRALWKLDEGFLASRPRDEEVLDRLRAERRLPEQPDYRAWRAEFLSAYRATETRQEWWHLPDDRTIRVVAAPNPRGGVTYLYDDVTENFRLETRFNALASVQGETLDSLAEGVAVFGTDGRLTLHNAAFAALWKLSPDRLKERPHVDEVVLLCRTLADDGGAWAALRGAVAGLTEARTDLERRLARRDGSVVHASARPLPDGATLLTFADVSASVAVERALTERNEALTAAARLRDTFVGQVSYELRSPLTNIIGFTQLLVDAVAGELNPRQHDYAAHIMRSSAALLAIVNDILDLATIDQGSLALDLAPVDLRAVVEGAAQGLQDRLVEADVRLDARLGDTGPFAADAKRLRQVVFNLLSNAIGFSAPGQTVTITAAARGDEVAIEVADEGRGMPAEVVQRVFDRFESHTTGSRHRGVGLGLSIVRSFVELHGGRVAIDSAPGRGTRVTCLIPARASLALREDAA